MTRAVRPYEGVPTRREAAYWLARERGSRRPGDRCPHDDGVAEYEGERDEAPDEGGPLKVRRRAEDADQHDPEHRQEEADKTAAPVHGIPDEGPDGPTVTRGEVVVAGGRWTGTGASARRCRGAYRGPGGPRPPGGLPAETDRIVRTTRRPPAAQGVAEVAARCRRWAAIRTGELSSPYPAYAPIRCTTSKNTRPPRIWV